MTEIHALKEKIVNALPSHLTDLSIQFGQLTGYVTPENIITVLQHLRDQLQFRVLIDICGVDYPERPLRFEVVYHLLSTQHNGRLRLKVSIAEGQTVPSAVSLYSSAGWWEREAFDMYGISFSGHPDLRRILTDYGFEGHPLRKDFPLTGYVEVRYDEERKKVVYEPVYLTQQFRTFDFLSPWEGMQDHIAPLPGDEKANNHGS